VIGSAIYSYEGIGVVLPIIEVTKDQSKLPKILLAVLLTNCIFYTGFGEFCFFVWGNELEGKPLITMNLPQGWIVWVIKCLYSVNIVISITL
jgi:solute carrier family 36 (proton-coupled amino acid transporter)